MVWYLILQYCVQCIYQSDKQQRVHDTNLTHDSLMDVR